MLRSHTDKPDIVIKNGKLDLENAAKFLDMSIPTLIRITFRKRHAIPFIKKNKKLVYDLKDLKRAKSFFGREVYNIRIPTWFHPEYFNIDEKIEDLKDQLLTVKGFNLEHSEN